MPLQQGNRWTQSWQQWVSRWRGGQRQVSALERRLDQWHGAALLCDEQGIVLASNARFRQMTGFGREELVGQLAPALRSGLHAGELLTSLLKEVALHGVWYGRLFSRHRHGTLLSEQVTVSRHQDYPNALLCLLSLTREDASVSLGSSSTGSFDALTGVLDRASFHAGMAQCCQAACAFGVLLLDLDQFNLINTQFDHQTGDRLLRQLAARLRRLTGQQSLLGRVGGDSFALVLPGVDSEAGLTEWANRVRSQVTRAFKVGPRKLRLSATLAGVLCPRDGQDCAQLLRHLDIALLEARRQQRDYGCYSASLMQHIAAREVMQDQLLEAITQGRITLAYQPIWDNQHQRVAKLEALARWTHPELGVISPADFIPLAEANGLIQLLGEQLLEQACRDLHRLHVLGYDWLQLSINRSMLEFKTLNPDGRDWLDVLESYHIAPSSIIFEITESIFMDPHEEHQQRIRALREAGCQIAIDDFGTGFSALNYLRRYPMDLVKIDRSFVQRIPAHHTDTQLLCGLIGMVHNLGMRIVVEGIEQPAQQAFIAAQGCAFTQGFLFSKPLNWDDLLSYLQRPEVQGLPVPARDAR